MRLAGILLGVLLATSVQAQTLSIQGDKFTIDGTPKFLTFISYFGAMGAPDIAADFHFLRSRGFDGVRIWPLLFTGPQLMRSDGSLRPDALDRLIYILDRAKDERLVVDVSFTGEHIPGLDMRGFRDGILATAQALRRFDNILFDIENERNIYGPGDRPVGRADIAAIYGAVKSVDPGRILTASNSSLVTDESTATFARDLGLDVTTYHDPREFNWFTLETTQAMVDRLKTAERPVYLQEPSPTRGDPRFPYYPQVDKAQYFLDAVASAKLAGAAAWCFHTDVGSDMRDGLRTIEERLRAQPEVEWPFAESLFSPRIALQAHDGLNYMSADGGGGADVRATGRTRGAWETFAMSVSGGGPIVHGDRVTFGTSDGVHYIQAIGGGGAGLRATATSIGAWETFIIETPRGGGIKAGDEVRLRPAGAPWYVVAEGGGGGNLTVNRLDPGPWETFRIQFVR